MIAPVAFRVLGIPSPQAGTKSVPTKLADGRTVYRKITEGGKGLKGWRQEVSDAAARHAARVGMMRGPVYLEVVFRFPMPASRPKWAREAGMLLCTVKPDLDKLVRAIGDSLKVGGLIHDDGQVVMIRVVKVEVHESWSGAAIRVSELDPQMSRAYVQAVLSNAQEIAA